MSPIFSRSIHHLISNNINLSRFFPVDISVARQLLKLPNDKQIILVELHKSTGNFKGLKTVIAALSRLRYNNLLILTFGSGDTTMFDELPFKCVHLGRLNDDRSLRLAYSDSSVFVTGSSIESFGQTTDECQACGTPVVCLGVTGLTDVVKHKLTGYHSASND